MDRKWTAVALAAVVIVLTIAALVRFQPWLLDSISFGASAGKLNFSWFVFRDVNRNGVYDMADRPYAGLPIRLTAPDGRSVVHDSNINGFANFKMSTSARLGPIHEAAEHEFAARIPDGWEATSGTRVEDVTFSWLEGSPAGLVADRVLEPLGVAPVPRFEGHVGGSSERFRLTVVSPSGKRGEVRLAESGGFRIRGEAGTWRLTRTDRETGERVKRKLAVGYYPKILTGAFFSQPREPEGGDVVTADYDDMITTQTVYEIPKGYRGLDWKNWLVTHNLFYEGDGYVNATVSSEFLAYNSSGHPATISSDEPFDFEGSYIGVAWPQARRGKVHVKAYRDGELQYHEQLRLAPRVPVYFHANYRDITRIEIHSDAYWQVVLDDTRFRLPD